MSKETKKTAAQRIGNLEETLIGTLKALGALNNDITQTKTEQETIKEAVRLLGSKVDAVVQLLNASQPLTTENIASVMMQNKADRMAADVARGVQDGVLTATDVVDKDSFLVTRELDDSGNVINLRMQFTMDSAVEPYKTKLLGVKVADKLKLIEEKATLEILEIYKVNQPEANAPASNDAAPASEGEVAAPEASQDQSAQA